MITYSAILFRTPSDSYLTEKGNIFIKVFLFQNRGVPH